MGVKLIIRCLFLVMATALLSAGPFDVTNKLPSASELLVIEGETPRWKTPPRVRAETEAYVTDFNGDRHGDLLALTPGFDISSLQNVGAVHAVYGRGTGLTAVGNQMFLFSDFGGTPSSGIGFGFSGSIGKLNDDEFMDAVIGTPGAEFGNNALAGALVFLTGSRNGLRPEGLIAGGDREDILSSYSLNNGDFDGDGDYEIVSGAVGFTVNGKLNAGAVYSYDSPDWNISGRWTLASAGIKGSPKANDSFGSYLAVGDINGDWRHDLIVASGFGNGRRGFANIIYGGPNGLKSAGNQQVRLRNGALNDRFALKATVCYCNNDRFADVAFNAPGYNDKGAVFLILGTEKGLSTTGAFVLESPWARDGDQFGFSMITAGVTGMYTFAFGSPDADVNNIENAGRVDFLDFSTAKWTPQISLGGPIAKDKKFGFGLNYTTNSDGDYFLNSGGPGSTVGGFGNAGLFLSAKFLRNNQGVVSVRNKKTFSLGNLAGSPQTDAFFGQEFANYPLSWEDDDW